METSAEILCRGCLTKVKPDGTYSFAWQEIKDLFVQCTSIKITAEEEMLPKQICSECYSKCEQWFSFKTMCQEVNDHLLSTVPPPPIPESGIRIKEEILDDEYLDQDDDLGAYTFGQLVADPPSEFAGVAADQEESLPAEDDLNNNHWTCLVCMSLLPESLQLRDHLKEHYSAEHPRCPLCNKAFNSGAKVYFHFMAKHNSSSGSTDTHPPKAAPSSAPTRAECSICKRKVSLPLFKHIYRTHMEPGCTTCPICQKECKDTGRIRRHLIVHTGERPFKCSVCGSFFSQTSSLYLHMRNVHKKEPKSQKSQKIRFVAPPPARPKEEKEEEAAWDASGEEGQVTGSSGGDWKEKKKKKSRRSSKKARFECPRCDYSASNLCDLRYHFVVHTDETPFYCSICGLAGRFRDTVRKHIALRHRGESVVDGGVKIKEGSIFELKRPWESMGFFDVETSRAKPRDYSGAKPACVSVGGEVLYQCPSCPKKLTRSRLLIHSVVHTKERPYLCRYCNTDFSQKGNAMNHIRNTHPEKDVEAGCQLKEDTLFAKQLKTEEVPAPKKGRALSQRRSDVGHARSSRKLTCNQCAVKCETGAAMKEHMKVHRYRATHPFECEECGNTFPNEGQVESHKYVHREERPFACEDCGYMFKTEQYLRKHKRRVKCTIPAFKVNPLRIVSTTGPGTKNAGRFRVVTTREPTKFHSCQRCEKQFQTRRGLKRHMTNHAAMDDKELSEGELVEEWEEQKPEVKKRLTMKGKGTRSPDK